MQKEFNTYQQLANRTAKPMYTTADDLLHAALCVTGEAGEFADCIKKHLAYGQELNTQNAIEKFGDMLWYTALACTALDVSLSEVAENIDKLRKRYPTRYPTRYTDEMAAFRADKQTKIEA